MSESTSLQIDNGKHGQKSDIKPKPAPVVLDIHSQVHKYTLKIVPVGQKETEVKQDG